MGSKNISISDEAYLRLKGLKAKNESFTDLINRLTNKTSILDLRGVLSRKEADSILHHIEESRKLSKERLERTAERLSEQ